MRILQVYNQYRSLFNGEEKVVFDTIAELQKQGHNVELLMRSSRGIEESLTAKASAFFTGIYSRRAKQEMAAKLRMEPVDVVHVHNLYPLFSPSVLEACRELKTPVLMSLHNQGLTCPKSDHLLNGAICEDCTTGSREWNCVAKNCRGNLVESIGYAIRSAVARKWRLFHDNVTFFIAMTQFAKRRLIANGYRESQIRVLPNTAPQVDQPVDASQGEYVAFAGRLSPEKGVSTLLKAAGLEPSASFALAGSGPMDDEARRDATSNVEFRGRLDANQMNGFYRRARVVVLPSTCFEMCPLVILEAMSHGVPVIASRIGGLGELVDDGVTGLLFEPGNEADLAAKVKQLWDSPDTCQKMGLAGREKALREYSTESYLRRLHQIYQDAAKVCGRDISETCIDRDSKPVLEAATHD